ncbi:MAG TPA: hypothetical protein PLP01_00805 [Phycisphaerae bacterium]|nr:hypothetical protein [Phycisphaerae bacterium]HOI53765.1 hypothetical protein [Phycisphaerae bacterium]
MSKQSGIIPILVATLCTGLALAAEDAAKPKTDDKSGEGVMEHYFLITSEAQPVGYRRVKSTKREKEIILEDEMALKYRDKMASFQSTVTYTTGDRPQPIRAEARTFVGDKKLMEGTLDFTVRKEEDGAEQKIIRIKVTGYFSKQLEEYSPPKEGLSEMTQPEGWLMFPAAWICLVPRMEPEGGMLENVVNMEFPDDLDFPELLNAKKDHALKWTQTENGERAILVGRRKDVETSPTRATRLVLNDQGNVKEYRMDEMSAQRCTKEEALKAVSSDQPRKD